MQFVAAKAKMMKMMMMMTSGFVERVINSPQTRCRSAKRYDE